MNNDCEYFGICRAYNTKSVICRKYKLRCYQYRNKSGVYKMKHNKLEISNKNEMGRHY